jgi:DNA-binding transcriptional regulator GbsR (MarR family)
MKKDNDKRKLEEVRNILIEGLGRVFSQYSFPDVLGHIYGVLFLADEPLGLDDIAQELGVSKSTVSNNIRILEGVGYARKVWVKGSRRDYYEVERNLSKVVLETIEKNYEKELEIYVGISESCKNLLGEVVDSSDERLKEKAEFYYQNIDSLEKQTKRVASKLSEFLLSVFQEEEKG